MAPLFLAKGGGCCMPHGACTLLRGPANSPQRLLVAAYVTTAASPTPCRATTSWNGLQATQQAPAVENTAKAPVCMTGPACHSMQWHGQPTALSQLFLFAPSEQEQLCTLLRVCSTAGDLQKALRTCLQDRPSCCSMQLHGQPTALSQLFSFAPSTQQ